jgi:hypothetical protein
MKATTTSDPKVLFLELGFAVKCPSKLSGTRCFANVEKDDINYSAKRHKIRSVDIVTSATSSLH